MDRATVTKLEVLHSTFQAARIFQGRAPAWHGHTLSPTVSPCCASQARHFPPGCFVVPVYDFAECCCGVHETATDSGGHTAMPGLHVQCCSMLHKDCFQIRVQLYRWTHNASMLIRNKSTCSALYVSQLLAMLLLRLLAHLLMGNDLERGLLSRPETAAFPRVL